MTLHLKTGCILVFSLFRSRTPHTPLLKLHNVYQALRHLTPTQPVLITPARVRVLAVDVSNRYITIR